MYRTGIQQTRCGKQLVQLIYTDPPPGTILLYTQIQDVLFVGSYPIHLITYDLAFPIISTYP